MIPSPTPTPPTSPPLGDLPEHWDVGQLRTVAEMHVSNVDNHTRDDEFPVRLCNYLNVYKNDRIYSAMAFMGGTASQEEIGKFSLEQGDMLITKDSESWDDIGVPSLVVRSADDLTSGYWLALLHPVKEILSPFLARPNSLGLALGVSVLWLQGSQPHLKNGSVYLQNRPTRTGSTSS